MVRGATTNVKRCDKVVEGRKSMYPDHYIMRAVIGEAIDVPTIGRIRIMLDDAGYQESPISYIRGLKFMIVFKEKIIALEFIRRQEDVWGSVLSSAVLWDGGQGTDFSWESLDNSGVVCGILSNLDSLISEKVEVRWEGRSFSVWVGETENTDFIQNLQELSEAALRSLVSSNASVIKGDAEMEDEEIRDEDCSSPPAVGKSASETVRFPVGNEPVTNMHAVHGGNETLPREKGSF
ncbi:hypothetical protein Hanom_Chr00s000004g01610361 [Helianthus anomalus]